jgi:hypothetical protein
MEQFRNIGLMGRPGNTVVVDTLEYLHHFLEGRGLKVIYDEDTAALMQLPGLQVCTRSMLGEACDLGHCSRWRWFFFARGAFLEPVSISPFLVSIAAGWASSRMYRPTKLKKKLVPY